MRITATCLICGNDYVDNDVKVRDHWSLQYHS